MNVMEAESITEILTNDHHFEQEGFVVLMRRKAGSDRRRKPQRTSAAPSNVSSRYPQESAPW